MNSDYDLVGRVEAANVAKNQETGEISASYAHRYTLPDKRRKNRGHALTYMFILGALISTPFMLKGRKNINDYLRYKKENNFVAMETARKNMNRNYSFSFAAILGVPILWRLISYGVGKYEEVKKEKNKN